MNQICKHCLNHKTCKKIHTPDCKDYNPNNIDVYIQELKNIKLTPERRKELQEKVDYFYYGHNK
jgi:hypothetical protein